MIKSMTVEEIKEMEFEDNVKETVSNYIDLLKNGESIQFRIKYTEKGNYLQIFKYDKKLYRYILEEKIRIS